MDECRLRLLVIIVDVFVIILTDDHEHVQFLFDPDARCRLERVEKFHENRLAEDEHSHIQVLGIFEVEVFLSVVGIFLY